LGADPTDYVRAVGPGTKNDTCPIFEGPQGALKSRSASPCELGPPIASLSSGQEHAPWSANPAEPEDSRALPGTCISDGSGLRPATPMHPEKEWAARAYYAGYGKHRDRAMWVGLMNCLLELARTRPWLLWDGSATVNLPRLVFSGPNLLSYLALQVCFLAAKQDAALCTHCQNLYKPKRAPKAGQRNYCPTCRSDGIPVRMAKRDQLARLRQAREI
jgi:hypothetical protein